MSYHDYEPERPRSSSGSSTAIIIVGVVIALMVGGALLIVVCLAAITTIGARANTTFTTVGASLSGGSTFPDPVTKLSADPDVVRQVLDNQQEAWNKGDLEGFMEGYWNSPDLTFYSGDRPRRGWEQTYARYKERYQDGGKEMGKLSFSNLKIDPIGSDQALVRGQWKLVLEDGERSGLFTLLMKRFPEGWKITHDHTSAKEP